MRRLDDIKSWTITAELDLRDDNANGMIIKHGGVEGGYGLYLKDGRPSFVYNNLALKRPTFTRKDPLKKGRNKLVVDFAYEGGGLGTGGKLTMTANGTKVARGVWNERSRRRSPFATAWISERIARLRWISTTPRRSNSPARSKK